MARLAMTSALVLMMCAGCAEVPDKGETGDEEIAVEGDEQALTACKATVTASPNPNADWSLTTIHTSGVTGCVPQYRYQYALPGSSTRVDIGTWTADSSVTFTPPSGVNGALKIFVQTQPQGGGVINTSQTQLLVGSTCRASAFGTSPTSPAQPGTSVSLSTIASCTNGSSAQVRFRTSNGVTTTTLSNWSAASSATWNTAGLGVGVYTLYSDVRRVGSAVVDHTASLVFTLGDTCSLSSLTSEPALSAAPSEGSVLLAATSSCGGGATAEYMFDYKLASGSTWSVAQSWSTSPTAVWNISGLPEGDYQVRARTRASGFTASQAAKTANFRVGGLCQSVTLDKVGTSPATAVTLSGHPSCTSGTPEFKFEVSPKVTPAVWSTLADWSTEPMQVVDEFDLLPGDYKFRVLLRARGHTSVLASNSLAFTLTKPVHLPDVLIAGADAGVERLRDELFATGAFATVDYIVIDPIQHWYPTPDLGVMLQYDVILVYANNEFSDPYAMGENLADYYDFGGRIVVAMAVLGGQNVGGRFRQSGAYMLLDVNAPFDHTYGASLGTIHEPDSPLLAGVSSFSMTYSFYATGQVVNDGTVVASWSFGAPLVIRGEVQGRKRVDLNFYPAPEYASGDYVTLIKNALLYE